MPQWQLLYCAASLCQSQAYLYPTSLSLVSNITILSLWPHLGLMRNSPFYIHSTELAKKHLEMHYCTLTELLPIYLPQFYCWLVSWTFSWLGFSYVPLPLLFYPVFFITAMTTSISHRKRLIMLVVDFKIYAVDIVCWLTFDHLRYTTITIQFIINNFFRIFETLSLTMTACSTPFLIHKDILLPHGFAVDSLHLHHAKLSKFSCANSISIAIGCIVKLSPL